MEKRNLYVIVAVVLIAGLALSFYGDYTGNSTLGVDKGACFDSDGGDDKFVKGVASYENRDYKLTDYCFARGGYGSDVWLQEYFCLEKIESRDIRCDNGCLNGACVK